MTLQEIQKKLIEITTNKIKTQIEISYESGVGYQTVRNIIKNNMEFEVKANTLKKIENYLNKL